MFHDVSKTHSFRTTEHTTFSNTRYFNIICEYSNIVSEQFDRPLFLETITSDSNLAFYHFKVNVSGSRLLILISRLSIWKVLKITADGCQISHFLVSTPVVVPFFGRILPWLWGYTGSQECWEILDYGGALLHLVHGDVSTPCPVIGLHQSLPWFFFQPLGKLDRIDKTV